jgi:large subunit ribosomal protein L30
MAKMREVEITLVKSGIGRPEKHRRVLKALGLTRMHKTVRLPASPTIMGMVRKVIHLVEVKDGS